MQLSLRHILLILSIATVILSFLFFGRLQGTYGILLIAGCLVAVLSFLVILFKDQRKDKFLWIAIVAASIGIQQLTEQWLIRQSYKILVNSNEPLLTEVNNIFLSKAGEVRYLRNVQQDSLRFSAQENRIIKELMDKTEVYLIWKDSTKVYYGTYGMLDVRLGINYFYSTGTPKEQYEWIKGHWYY